MKGFKISYFSVFLPKLYLGFTMDEWEVFVQCSGQKYFFHFNNWKLEMYYILLKCKPVKESLPWFKLTTCNKYDDPTTGELFVYPPLHPSPCRTSLALNLSQIVHVPQWNMYLLLVIFIVGFVLSTDRKEFLLFSRSSCRLSIANVCKPKCVC